MSNYDSNMPKIEVAPFSLDTPCKSFKSEQIQTNIYKLQFKSANNHHKLKLKVFSEWNARPCRLKYYKPMSAKSKVRHPQASNCDSVGSCLI